MSSVQRWIVTAAAVVFLLLVLLGAVAAYGQYRAEKQRQREATVLLQQRARAAEARAAQQRADEAAAAERQAAIDAAMAPRQEAIDKCRQLIGNTTEYWKHCMVRGQEGLYQP